MLINRTAVKLHPPTSPLLVAECVQCGDTFEAHTPPHPRTGVEHRCGGRGIGSTWTLLEAPEVATARARHRRDPARTITEHLEAVDLEVQSAALGRRRAALEAVPA